MKQWYSEGESLNQIARRLGQDFRMVYATLKKHGVQMRSRANHGSANGQWKGGRTTDKDGYTLIHRPDHPDADSHGYVREHRLVAEEKLGRRLTSEEVVHHKNDVKSDNSPGNLKVYATNAEHLADTLKGKCPNWTVEGRARTLEGARRPRKQNAIQIL